MLREHARALEKVIVAVDLVLVLLSLLVAGTVVGHSTVAHFLRTSGPFLVTCSLVWYLVLRYGGFYRSLRTRSYLSLFFQVTQTAVLAGVMNAALLFAMAPRFSRGVYATHLALAFALILGWKFVIRATQKAVRKRGYNYRRILVVGAEDAASNLARHIESHTHWGYQIVGFVQQPQGPKKEEFEGYPVLGRLDRLVDICKQHTVDEIIFTLSREHIPDIERVLPRLEAMGVTVRLTLDYYRPRQSRTMFDFMGEDDPLPVITYYRMTLDPTQLSLKRLLDFVGSLVGLILTAFVLPFVALAIKLDSRGPIFFGQRRVGQNGRTFTCHKFRTMYIDAEARKEELLARNEMKGAIFKMRDDPRVTRVGKFLRKTSVDELPQFWNVMRGEMSLVGTRPPTPDEVAQYEEWQRGRISIKPGLTGMWQTSGRNKVDDFDKICQLDMAYIDNWSLGLDLKLLAKTLAVVTLGVGAR
jgi:exopolysaccharide biosynthesis polyprenyl glycosylphosphotransferase